MTNTSKATTKTRKALYWVATAITASAYLMIGGANLAHNREMMAGFTHLGYPPYLATILGTWSLLGAAAILVPGLPHVKEWAYAGMFFNLTGAAMSHAVSRDPLKEITVPIGLLVVALISMAFRYTRGTSIATQMRTPRGA